MFEKSYHPNAVDAELQTESRRWWSRNPMTYDWHGTSPAQEGTPEFYEDIDRRFFAASPHFGGSRSFSELIPFESLKGKRVLEIGCGQGSHTQLLVSAGCRVTAIDLTERAVNLTRTRLALNHLDANVREMDAERMQFADNEFDFVWSWGVIHHSPDTQQIVREVARVLKAGGEFRFMVYNRHSFDSYVKLLRGVLSGKTLRGMSRDDILSFYTDGYLARFYSRQGVEELVERSGLEVTKTSVLGQTSELLPLPGKGIAGKIKYGVLAKLPKTVSKTALSSFGSFLFVTARKIHKPS